MCGRFGCLDFKTEWLTGLKGDINIYLTDADADAGQSLLTASVMVGDYVAPLRWFPSLFLPHVLPLRV